jgi:hypothetical protein
MTPAQRLERIAEIVKQCADEARVNCYDPKFDWRYKLHEQRADNIYRLATEAQQEEGE